jgi:hypothetical protein
VRHHATGFQNGKEVVGGGFQNFLRADEIETFATRHAPPVRLSLRLVTGTKVVNDILPRPFGNFRVVCGEISFGERHPQDRTFGSVIAGVAQSHSLIAVACVQTFFSPGFGILKVKNAIASEQPESVFHVQLRG